MTATDRITTRARRREGFTLIELLVVVVIVGVLASIGLPIYQGYIRTVNLEKAVPYLRSIATKQQIRQNRTGKYLATLSEQDIINRLGVDVSGAGDFCFMIFCADNTICVDNAEAAATAGTLIPTPAGNTPLFQVIAVLRQISDASVAGAGSTCAVSTGPAKTDAAGWVNTSGTGAGGEGRVVILTYPPPADGVATSVTIDGHVVQLDWNLGITKTDAEVP